MDYVLTLLGPMFDGLWTTLTLFIVTIVCSIPLGFLFTLMSNSKIKVFKVIAQIYIYLMRSTPLLLQLLFFYFGLPIIAGAVADLTGIPIIAKMFTFDRFPVALIGFTLNYAAYFSEIFRGGILAVDKGQYEAAQVLGLNRWQTNVRIVIPQMIRVSMPTVASETINLVKDTALLYAVAVPDVLHYAKVAVNRDFNITPFLVAAVFYLVINFVITMVFKYLEKKFAWRS